MTFSGKSFVRENRDALIIASITIVVALLAVEIRYGIAILFTLVTQSPFESFTIVFFVTSAVFLWMYVRQRRRTLELQGADTRAEDLQADNEHLKRQMQELEQQANRHGR